MTDEALSITIEPAETMVAVIQVTDEPPAVVRVSEGLPGPPGADSMVPGPQGIQGIPGSQGLQGVQGIPGIQGEIGVTGLQGIPGIQGIPGVQGEPGIDGLQGDSGPQGSPGYGIVLLGSVATVAALPDPITLDPGNGYVVDSDGDLYVVNDTGTAWVDVGQIVGPQGSQGIQGIQGIQGFDGSAGIQGIPGVQGTAGSQGIQGIQGIQGPEGVAGSQIITGTNPPSSAVGEEGDWYLDSSTDVFYGPKSAEGFGPSEYVLADPSGTINRAVGDYLLGNEYQAMIGGQIIGARFYRNTAETIHTHQIKIWNEAQVLLGTTEPTVEAVGYEGWVYANFPAPIPVTIGQKIVVACAQHTMIYTTHIGPVTNASHMVHLNAHYGAITDAYPGNVQIDVNRYVDPVWQPESSDSWPEVTDLTGSQGPQGIQGIQGIQGVAGTNGAVGPAGFGAEYQGGVSQPPGSLWLPTGAIMENFNRYKSGPITATAALGTGNIRTFPLGILKAGHTATGLGFITGAAASGITNSWAGICTASDRVIRAISATSTTVTPPNQPRVFTFDTPYTPVVDTFLLGFVMYAATVPTMMGYTQFTSGVTGSLVGPILTGSSGAGHTTPPAVLSTLAALTATNFQVYLWLTGTTP